MEKRRFNFERHLALAIALWGGLCSAAFAGLLAVFLDLSFHGFLKGAAIFGTSGFLSAALISRPVMKRYREHGLAGLEGTGQRWGSLAGFTTAIPAAIAVFGVMSAGSDTRVFDSLAKEIGVLVAAGVIYGAMFGLLVGIVAGGVCGRIFEARVTKWISSSGDPRSA